MLDYWRQKLEKTEQHKAAFSLDKIGCLLGISNLRMNMKYLLGFLFGLYTPVIFAAKPVIDVANLAKNAVIAMQSENQTAVQLKQLAEQTLMYENMVQNSRVLPDFKLSQKLLGRVPGSPQEAISLANYQSEKIIQLMRNMEKIQLAQKGIVDTTYELFKLSHNSGLTTEQIIELDAKNRNIFRQNSTNYYNLYKGYADEIATNQSRNDEITTQLSATGGAHQTLMTIGLQNRLLSDQLNQLISIETATAQKQATDELSQQDQDDLQKQRRKAFLEMRERNLKKWSGKNGH